MKRALYELVVFGVLCMIAWGFVKFGVVEPMNVVVEREQRITMAASCACRPLIKGRADCEAIVRDILRRNASALGKAEASCSSLSGVLPKASPGVWH